MRRGGLRSRLVLFCSAVGFFEAYRLLGGGFLRVIVGVLKKVHCKIVLSTLCFISYCIIYIINFKYKYKIIFFYSYGILVSECFCREASGITSVKNILIIFF